MTRLNKPLVKQIVEADKKLNSTYAAAFSTPSGQKVLENFINELQSVMPLNSSEFSIVHREGGRFVLRAIINRIEKGKNND